jgi:hypothetical protein
VLGMGLDLTTLLAVVSTIGVGNPLSLTPGFSIGGPSAKVIGALTGGLLPVPQGLSATHNVIEADSSSTRDDIYMTGTVGDCVTMNMTKFLEVYNSIPVNGAMTMDMIAARAAKRFDESVSRQQIGTPSRAETDTNKQKRSQTILGSITALTADSSLAMEVMRSQDDCSATTQ